MAYAIAVGSCTVSEQETLVSAATHASTELEVTPLDDMVSRLEQHAGHARCVIASNQDDLKHIVARLRERASLLTVPVISVVAHASEGLYGSAFAAGADDVVVAGDRGALTRRLARLLTMKPAATNAAPHGLALIASADPDKRRTLGHALRRAGFDATYAADPRELSDPNWSTRLGLVVVAEDFPGGPDAAIGAARAASQKPSLPALVVPSASGLVRSVGYDASANAHAQLLSFVEEVIRGEGQDQRASKRLAYATLVSFRIAGTMQQSFGLSHNMSREGLFVRTLDPPKRTASAWVELRAPGSDDVVHVRGEVVWCRDPGALGATPFGFGMRLVSQQCPAADHASYVAGYDTYPSN